MISIVTSAIGSILGNPMMVLAIIGTFFLSSWFSDAKSWFDQRNAIKPWMVAVEERDRTIEIKDKLTEEALTARDNHVHELAQLRAELDAAEIARKMAGAADCRWTDDDLRVLNPRN